MWPSLRGCRAVLACVNPCAIVHFCKLGSGASLLRHSLRYSGLNGNDSFRRKWHKLVLCIEGPEEPAHMDAFLEPLASALQRLGPPVPGANSASSQGGDGDVTGMS